MYSDLSMEDPLYLKIMTRHLNLAKATAMLLGISRQNRNIVLPDNCLPDVVLCDASSDDMNMYRFGQDWSNNSRVVDTCRNPLVLLSERQH